MLSTTTSLVRFFLSSFLPSFFSTSFLGVGADLAVSLSAADNCEDYIHRIGRTGRGGATGTSYTCVLISRSLFALDRD